MSSTVSGAEKISKKRKHGGDARNPQKKQKQAGTAAATDGPDQQGQLVVKSNGLNKRKQKKHETPSNELEDAVQGRTDLVGDDNSQSTNEKKRRLRIQEPQNEPEDVDEAEQVQASMSADEEIPDVPAIEGERGEVESAGQADDPESLAAQQGDSEQLQSDIKTAFHSIRMSLYLPIPPIAAQTALSAILAIHLAPLLLTYFPPARGVILSYHDPVLSARPQSGLNRPLLPPSDGQPQALPAEETPSRLGDEFGSCWVWLTVTFLVFKPEPGEELQGWTNAASEGFIGLVSYNYFQASISKARIPKKWVWNGPSRQGARQRKPPRKGKLNDSDVLSHDTQDDSQETVAVREDDAIDGTVGTFVDENGQKLSESLKFRVVDLEMIPAQERGQRFALQLEGTLLDKAEERAVREEERQRWENRQMGRKSRSRASGTSMMSGGLSNYSRSASLVSTP